MERPTVPWREKVTDYKFTYLLIALLTLVLAPLIVGQSVTRSLTFGFTFLGVLVFGFLATVKHRRARVVALVLGLIGAAAQISSFILGARRHPEFRLAAFTAFLAFLVVIIVLDALKAEAVTWDKIQGAVCAYLLIGLAWGLAKVWLPTGSSGRGPAAARLAGRSARPMVSPLPSSTARSITF